MAKKKRKKKKKKAAYSKNDTVKRGDPQSFLKSIGVKIQGSGDNELSESETAILRLGKPDLIDSYRKAFRKARDEDNENQCALIEFFHTNLDLVKIRCGFDFKHICKIATELKNVSVPPQSRVLDIGGGAGHLAFWMAAIWDGCSVTVADRYSHLGTEWANEIGEDRVNFVDAWLPDLGALRGQKFDIVVLSRVLSVILDESLTSGMGAFSIESYFTSSEGKELMNKLEELLEGVAMVLASEGSVIVAESWSYARILTLSKAFEKKALSINLDLFPPDRVSNECSVVVFSKSAPQSHIQNIPLALATRIDMGDHMYKYQGIAAESIRKLFGDVAPRLLLEYASGDERGSVIDEVLEREGLMLLYRTFTNGSRMAILHSATEIPQALEGFQKMAKTLVAEKDGTIVRMFLANDIEKSNDIPNQMAGRKS